MKSKVGKIPAAIILFLSLGSAIFSALHLPLLFIQDELKIQSVAASGSEPGTTSTDSSTIDSEPSSEGSTSDSGTAASDGSGSQLDPSNSNNPSTPDTGTAAS